MWLNPATLYSAMSAEVNEGLLKKFVDVIYVEGKRRARKRRRHARERDFSVALRDEMDRPMQNVEILSRVRGAKLLCGGESA